MGTTLFDKLTVESLTWYAFGLIALIFRYWSQWLRYKRLKAFRADDVLMLFCFCCYTILIVTLYKYGALYLNPPDFDSPKSIEASKHAGILELLIETSEVTSLWGIKGCFLLLYYHLTIHLFQQKVVIVTAIYCTLTYIATLAALYGGFCRPFSEYLVPEPKNTECVTWFSYKILQFCFNVSSDLIIFSIPISVVWNSCMSAGQKAGLYAFFSLGFFVIISACLTKYYILTDIRGEDWVLWYVREGSMAIIVGNVVLWRRLMSLAGEKTALFLQPLASLVSSRRSSNSKTSMSYEESVQTIPDVCVKQSVGKYGDSNRQGVGGSNQSWNALEVDEMA